MAPSRYIQEDAPEGREPLTSLKPQNLAPGDRAAFMGPKPQARRGAGTSIGPSPAGRTNSLKKLYY